ncbi:MAG TPA: hypothetical protein VNN12_05415 [Dehalococcoidia bacterium]|nr:hypothetical protein [Dehalococcoidia bacterium]
MTIDELETDYLDAPCGCPACSHGVQPGHFACEPSPEYLLRLEAASQVRRAFVDGAWRWIAERHTPQTQLERAHALARAYGHEWGVLIHPVEIRAIEDLSIIPALVAERRYERAIVGIDRPDVDDDGVIRHTSGTGRVSWVVAPDGRVEFRVNRPSGTVLVLDAPTDVAARASVSVLGTYYARHYREIERAIRALGVQVELPSLPLPDAEELDDAAAATDIQETYGVEHYPVYRYQQRYYVVVGSLEDVIALEDEATACELAQELALTRRDAWPECQSVQAALQVLRHELEDVEQTGLDILIREAQLRLREAERLFS